MGVMTRPRRIAVLVCGLLTVVTLLLTCYLTTDSRDAAKASMHSYNLLANPNIMDLGARDLLDLKQSIPKPKKQLKRAGLEEITWKKSNSSWSRAVEIVKKFMSNSSWSRAVPISNSARSELQKIIYAHPRSADPRVAFDKVVALSSLLPKISNISRIKTPSPEVFRNDIAPAGFPVIFTDMLVGEKLGQWTWEYVRHKWGKTVYQNTRQGNYSTKTSKAGKHFVNRVTVTLEDFIDVVTGKRKAGEKEQRMYIAKKRLIPVEALEAEFYYPHFYPGAHKKCYLEPTGW